VFGDSRRAFTRELLCERLRTMFCKIVVTEGVSDWDLSSPANTSRALDSPHLYTEQALLYNDY